MSGDAKSKLAKRITVPAGAVGVVWIYQHPEGRPSNQMTIPVPTDGQVALWVSFVTPNGEQRLAVDLLPDEGDPGTQCNLYVYDSGRMVASMTFDAADQPGCPDEATP